MARHTRESVAGLTELKHGRLTLAAIPAVSAFYLPGRLNRFLGKHPGIELVILEESSTGVAELVGNGTAEIGFLQLPELDQRLETRKLLTESHHVLLHQKHRLADARSVTIKQLSGESFIQYRGRVHETVLHACRRAGFDPKVACVTSELATVHALVHSGLGVAILPEMAIPTGLKGTRAVPLRNPGLKRDIGLARRHATPLSAAGKAFETFL